MNHYRTKNITYKNEDFGFKVKIPEDYAQTMLHEDTNHPLNLQFLPSEHERSKEGLADPLQEISTTTPPGLLHKYPHRVLLTLTQACAIHCRYCFRRHFPYTNENPFKNLNLILEYITKDESIHEIILSGGDPLMLSNQKLKKLFDALKKISHIKTIRLHTRMPMIVAARIDSFILSLPKKYNFWQWVVVLHINHDSEFNVENNDALLQLSQNHFTVLNQSVLLKGVNDNLKALVDLSNALWKRKVLPYYLHQLDPVKQGMHFKVADDVAKSLYQQLQGSLPGYLVPKLAQEIPGFKHKLLI
jgi:EF-P beta-lysylation protein EpmB